MTTSENKQGTLATLGGAAGDFVCNWRTLGGIEVFVISPRRNFLRSVLRSGKILVQNRATLRNALRKAK